MGETLKNYFWVNSLLMLESYLILLPEVIKQDSNVLVTSNQIIIFIQYLAENIKIVLIMPN